MAHTDGLIHDENYFANVYEDVDVSADTFSEQKELGIYKFTGDFEISSDCESIKYCLYDEAPSEGVWGTPLKIETVPVLRDGTSIDTVVEWYKRTSTEDVPEKPEAGSEISSGWSKTPPAFSGLNNYLWNFESITDTAGNVMTTTEPVLMDKSGKQIEYLKEYYAATSTTELPSEWSEEVPVLNADTHKYLWNKEVIKYVGVDTVEEQTPAIIGVYGDKGDKGDTGDAGNNAVKYYIVASNQVVKRAEDGIISPSSITFTFKKIDGNSAAESASVYSRIYIDGIHIGFYYGTNISVNMADYENASEIECNIYSDSEGTNLIDSEKVEVLDEAENAITVSLGNDSASVATNANYKVDGNVVLKVPYTVFQGLTDITANITNISMTQTQSVVYSLEPSYTDHYFKLYINDGTEIPDAYSITVTFIGTNLKGESVTRQKTFALSRSATGEQGSTGAQGGGYLGTCTAQPTSAGNTNDFYLDVTNQVIWYYEDSEWKQDPEETPGDEWVPSWRWNAAVQDCVKNAGSTGTLLKAANIWVDKLVAGTALIDRIAAKVIKLQEDAEGNKGVIYGGDRYKEDGTDNDTSKSGFYLDTEGNLKAKDAEFENATISGKLKAADGLCLLNVISGTDGTLKSLYTLIHDKLSTFDVPLYINDTILTQGCIYVKGTSTTVKYMIDCITIEDSTCTCFRINCHNYDCTENANIIINNPTISTNHSDWVWYTIATKQTGVLDSTGDEAKFSFPYFRIYF